MNDSSTWTPSVIFEDGKRKHARSLTDQACESGLEWEPQDLRGACRPEHERKARVIPSEKHWRHTPIAQPTARLIVQSVSLAQTTSPGTGSNQTQTGNHPPRNREFRCSEQEVNAPWDCRFRGEYTLWLHLTLPGALTWTSSKSVSQDIRQCHNGKSNIDYHPGI